MITITVPLLLAAIDPQAEAELASLNHAVVEGRYLQETDHPVAAPQGFSGIVVPVLATTDPYDDDDDVVTVSSLPAAAVDVVRQGLSPTQLAAALAKEPTTPVTQTTIAASTVYDEFLAALGKPSTLMDAYWTPGVCLLSHDLRWRPTSDPSQQPRRRVGQQLPGGYRVRGGSHRQQRRRLPLAERDLSNNAAGAPPVPVLETVGEFDPSKLPGFGSLSQVPMETYYPPTATGANAASRQALGDQSLQPDANLGGYLQEPPLMLTTLDSLSALEQAFPTSDAAAPISAVRIRVGGVHGTVKQQLAQIASVAAAIQKATGLHADVTAGSSPTTETISLPAGKYGRAGAAARRRLGQEGGGTRHRRRP